MRWLVTLLFLVTCSAWAETEQTESESIDEIRCLKGGCYKSSLDVVAYKPVTDREAIKSKADDLMGSAKSPPSKGPAGVER